MRFVSASLVLLFIFGVGIANASLKDEDLRRKMWSTEFGVGAALPGSSTNDMQSISLFLQAALARRLSSHWAVGAEVGSAPSIALDGTLQTDADGDGIQEYLKATSRNALSVFEQSLFVKFGTIDDWGTFSKREVHRYFILGAGAYEYNLDSGHYVVNGPTSSGQTLVDHEIPLQAEGGTFFGVNLGVGLLAQVWKRCEFGFDLRYHRIYKAGENFDYYIPSLKFAVRFDL